MKEQIDFTTAIIVLLLITVAANLFVSAVLEILQKLKRGFFGELKYYRVAFHAVNQKQGAYLSVDFVSIKERSFKNQHDGTVLDILAENIARKHQANVLILGVTELTEIEFEKNLKIIAANLEQQAIQNEI